MLRQSLNELEITIQIAGLSALLVKDGRYTDEVKKRIAGDNRDLKNLLPDMMFFTTDPLDKVERALGSLPAPLALQELRYAIPGSSIRGAWRSHLERVLRSLGGPKVCDPLSEGGKPPHTGHASCSSVYGKKDESRPEVPYRVSCPLCRLFGNTVLGSRLSFGDATPNRDRSFTTELIDGISISRYTGSVAGKYRAMVLRNAAFRATLRLRNFELWHLGLLAHLFNDLGAGGVPLGSGKNKGLGKVKVFASSMVLTEYGLQDASADGRLRGMAERLDPQEADAYDMIRFEQLPRNVLSPARDAAGGWRHVRGAAEPAVAAAFWEAVRPYFNEDVWNHFPSLADARAAYAGGRE